MYRYDIPLSDLISFAERARSALCKSCCLLAVRFFRYLARSFLFQGLLDTLRVRSFFRVCSIPCAFVPFSGSARYLARSFLFQGLLDTSCVERSVPFQGTWGLLDAFCVQRSVPFQALCSLRSGSFFFSIARAESKTSSRVLRYVSRRLDLFFS